MLYISYMYICIYEYIRYHYVFWINMLHQVEASRDVIPIGFRKASVSQRLWISQASCCMGWKPARFFGKSSGSIYI